MNAKSKNITPVMKQFWDIKDKHPNSILLFRMGDFYETFDTDAKLTSEILGIALTKRSNGAASSVALAGFPYHSLEQYLYKLLKAGHRVAICEQVEDAKLSKGIVKREVLEIVSPGTTLSENFLNNNKNNYLCSAFHSNNHIGIALLDHSTGEFFSNKILSNDFDNIFSKYDISEILILESQKEIFNSFKSSKNILINYMPDWVNDCNYAYEILCNQFKVKTLKGFGFNKQDISLVSSGIIIHYINENLKSKVRHINSLKLMPYDNVMQLDSFTIRNLELFNPLSHNNKKGTLLSAIDKTITSSGSRLFKNWLSRPLIDSRLINKRLSNVNDFFKDDFFLEQTRLNLKSTYDIYRIISKVSCNKANPVDLLNLTNSLKFLPLFKSIIPKTSKNIIKLFKSYTDSTLIISLIDNTISTDASPNIKKGNFIKDGFSKELDQLRTISSDANKWMLDYQKRLREETNISSLKIGYNRVFGYYIDVTKTHIHKVPDFFLKKQTLVNNERFFTEDLKGFEDQILNANHKILDLENKYFDKLCLNIIKEVHSIQSNAEIISKIDIFSSLALLAKDNNYIRPIIDNNYNLEIRNGRHPVVEQLIEDCDDFIGNDTNLVKDSFLSIITGPNMAGKSTYLRQTGIIVIMAQIGSFVPAEYAKIGLVDKLFTRVGASDNLSEGESTFLVEMQETANIINNATKNSLILLDEIGRGTSTYDGLSIAWSVTEHIHNKIKAKTLFATHYHELVQLGEKLNNSNNLNIQVEESSNKSDIVFLRKIVKGGTDKSYGIYVAKMAGLPLEIIIKAKIHLELLTANNKISTSNNKQIDEIISKINLNTDNDLLDFLKKININSISPIEALNLLSKMIDKYVK